MSLYQQVTYNGFTFPYATLSESSAVIYAEDRQTHLGTQYIFRVSGCIFAEHASDGNLLTYMDNMRCMLQEPRGEFLVKWGTTPTSPWLPAELGGTTIFDFKDTDDVDFGPKPSEVKFTRFSGGLAALYEWSVAIFVKECWSGSCTLQGRQNQILAITRRYQHTIDADGLTTRTVSGRIIVTAQSVAATGGQADAFRFMVTPPIPVNFKRTVQSFSQSEDGRELSFEFTDVETIYTLPKPITDGQASWSVRLADTGAMVNYALSGWFSAASSVDKSQILTAISNLALKKFPVNQKGFIFETRELTENIYSQNRIDFNITATSAGGVTAQGQPDFTVGINTLTVSPPDSTGLAWPIYPDGGDASQSSGLLAPAPIAWDSCKPSQLSQTSLSARGILATSPSGTPTPPEGPTNAQNDGTSMAHQTAPYVAYSETISYEINNQVRIFRPKVMNAQAIAQQTGNPIIYVIQAGYASRLASSAKDGPLASAPYGINATGTSNSVVLDAYVSPVVAEPIGDGSNNRYTIHWRYVIALETPLDKGSLDPLTPSWPLDPRRPSTTPEFLAKQTLPDAAIVKPGSLK